jgi:hypothetical protein
MCKKLLLCVSLCWKQVSQFYRSDFQIKNVHGIEEKETDNIEEVTTIQELES